MNLLENYTAQIKPLNEAAIREASLHLDQLTKPPGSLGKLEAIAKQVAGITGVKIPDLSRKAVIVMAGDHGVCAEGISAYPAEVTPQMVMNFLHGGAAVNVLARQAGAEVVCVDIGVNADLEHPQLISRKVRKGTNNLALGSAMTREEALQAIAVGWELVEELAGKGVRLFATGEMGIGNTTSSAALLVVLTGIEVQQAVGRGTGIDETRWLHKQDVITRAIAVNQADANDPLDVLTKLGGLEIAGLVGVILGAAAHASPVIIDGFISSAAALVASRLAPLSVDYMLSSHLSLEQGHAAMLNCIGLSPMMQMDMRLGEGTGAVLAFHFVDAALKIMSEMATFTSAGVSKA